MSISSEIGKRVREYLQAANVKSRRKTLEYSVKSNKRQTFHFFCGQENRWVEAR
jgi:hypothetical protein